MLGCKWCGCWINHDQYCPEVIIGLPRAKAIWKDGLEVGKEGYPYNKWRWETCSFDPSDSLESGIAKLAYNRGVFIFRRNTALAIIPILAILALLFWLWPEIRGAIAIGFLLGLIGVVIEGFNCLFGQLPGEQ